jgi:hypothetical protein
VISIDCKSNEAIPKNVEALEDKSNDYEHNQVKVTREAREVMLYNCMKRKVKSGTKEVREVISNDYDRKTSFVAWEGALEVSSIDYACSE